ncbi:uncharacterized protein [Aegilops tauschii subsp. strangulata]|uniref:uncharacterized protein n=1 Tax=Aegilops tauschii subsp. strangulata TaxID=200361 RepID=UPI003CC86375
MVKTYARVYMCCRHTGGIGGCLLALSIWSRERLPVGRPKTVKYEDSDDKDDSLRLPTWAYKWDVLNETTDDPSVMYKLYKSELDAITPEQLLDGFDDANILFLTCRLDRKKQRKIKDWASHHRKYVVQFALSVEQARAGKRAQLREHCPIAFNNYLAWFLASTRVEVCQPAYAEEILEEPTVFDEVAQHQYNALVRKGNSVIPSAPMMNFVRAQIKKAADETETILETTPAGKSDGEGALREFIKRQGQKLRRLSNLFGCRDPEYVSPERSRSATPSDPASGQSHGEPFTDEDVGGVTQEVADDMTLGTYRARSAYELKPRRGINKYTPEDFTQRGKRTVSTSRMAALDDYLDDDVEPEAEPEPERVPLPRKVKKISVKRGGGPSKRGKH